MLMSAQSRQNSQKTHQEKKKRMRLPKLALLTLLIAIGGRADVLPCLAGTIEAMITANTTCAIGDKAFTFTSEDINHTGAPIGFVPDLGDSGFTLTGYTATSLTSNQVFYSIQFTAATLDGNPTIEGLSTQVLNPVVAGSGFSFGGAYVQSDIGPTGFPYDVYQIFNGSVVELTSGPIAVPPTNAITLFANSEGAGDVSSFSGAHYEILQSTSPAPVPEPGCGLLFGSVLAALAVTRKRRNA
jgi:hypothetical protein